MTHNANKTPEVKTYSLFALQVPKCMGKVSIPRLHCAWSLANQGKARALLMLMIRTFTTLNENAKFMSWLARFIKRSFADCWNSLRWNIYYLCSVNTYANFLTFSKISKGLFTLDIAVCVVRNGLHQHRDWNFYISLQKRNCLLQTHVENAVMWMSLKMASFRNLKLKN